MEKLTTYEKIFCERNEKTITTEITLPEYLPNAARIVRVTALPCLSGCECTDGIRTDGHIRFSVIYATDPDGSLRCAAFSEDFSHTFTGSASKSDFEGAAVDCKAVAVRENASITSPRRLSLSCTLILEGVANAKRETELFDIEETDTVRKRVAEEEALSVVPIRGCEFRIEERLQLDKGLPEIKEIISSDCSLGTLKSEISDGKCRFSGSALLSCIYLARDEAQEAQYVSIERQLPYTATFDLPEGYDIVGACAYPCITQLTAETSHSSYGDSDGIRVELSGCINGRLYGNAPVTVCRDILCTRHDCDVDIGHFPCDLLMQLISEDTEINETVRMSLGGITEIISGSIGISDCHTEISDGRPLALATAHLRILGANSKGGFESAYTSFTVKHPAMRPVDSGIGKYRLEGELSAGAPECRIENGEVVCRFSSHLDLAVILRNEVHAVSAIAIDDTSEYQRDKSRYVICYPDKSDTVWSVAKAYKVLPEDIASANGLKGDKLEKRCLIIPR